MENHEAGRNHLGGGGGHHIRVVDIIDGPELGPQVIDRNVDRTRRGFGCVGGARTYARHRTLASLLCRRGRGLLLSSLHDERVPVRFALGENPLALSLLLRRSEAPTLADCFLRACLLLCSRRGGRLALRPGELRRGALPERRLPLRADGGHCRGAIRLRCEGGGGAPSTAAVRRGGGGAERGLTSPRSGVCRRRAVLRRGAQPRSGGVATGGAWRRLRWGGAKRARGAWWAVDSGTHPDAKVPRLGAHGADGCALARGDEPLARAVRPAWARAGDVPPRRATHRVASRHDAAVAVEAARARAERARFDAGGVPVGRRVKTAGARDARVAGDVPPRGALRQRASFSGRDAVRRAAAEPRERGVCESAVGVGADGAAVAPPTAVGDERAPRVAPHGDPHAAVQPSFGSTLRDHDRRHRAHPRFRGDCRHALDAA